MVWKVFFFHQQSSIANYSARFDHRTVTQLHRFAQLTLKSQHKFLKVKQEKQETVMMLPMFDILRLPKQARLLSTGRERREAAKFNSK